MDDPKAVQAQLPACVIKHPVKMKELRTQWDHGCSKILADARLSAEQKIHITMSWLSKAGVRDWVLGKLILNFARPLPIPPSEEQKKERNQKKFVSLAYKDDLPHLRAVNKIVTERLDAVPPGTRKGSLQAIDSVDDREQANPGTMFAEFAKSIDEQVALEYASMPSEVPFADAAE